MMTGRGAWLTLAVMSCLAGCADQVQTSSGQSYLAARPEFHPPPGATVDRAVYEAANVEPTLRFPARIGVARIQAGRLTAIPPAEAAVWADLVKDAPASYGEFVAISPLVAEMTASSLGSATAEVIDKIRIGAARQHVDAVLIYEVTGASSDKASVLSVADLTVIGAFLIPSRSIAGEATANALLVDVRNGYPYGTATSSARQTGFVTNNGSTDKSFDLERKAEIDAVGKLAADVGRMMARLKTDLETKELAALRAKDAAPPAAPAPAGRRTRG